LQSLASLSAVTFVVELDLSQNQLRDLTTMPALVHVEKLVLANNSLTEICGIGQLRSLKHLLLQGNRLGSWNSISLPELQGLHALCTLYLQHIDGSEVSMEHSTK
jgi:Leucine-rich repeat (LRR) protein